MGSSGSGSLSDYSEQIPNPSESPNGGTSNIDPCDVAFSCSLQEVSRCSYHQKRGVPPAGTEVSIVFNMVRLAVVDSASADEVGYLPTKYNYIKNCLDSGYSYNGVVTSSVAGPTPSVYVDITPA